MHTYTKYSQCIDTYTYDFYVYIEYSLIYLLMFLQVKLLLNSCKNSTTTPAMLLTINKFRLNLKL